MMLFDESSLLLTRTFTPSPHTPRTAGPSTASHSPTATRPSTAPPPTRSGASPFTPFIGGPAAADLRWDGQNIPADSMVLIDL